MQIAAAVQIIAFAILAIIAIAGALGMATTMSMFRSGIFLMASFMGVGGLFILLMADLLGMLQIMMYIGGMLVMILFMVLFSHDPGGEMMAGMKMSAIEKLFSRGLAHGNGQQSRRADHNAEHGSEMHNHDPRGHGVDGRHQIHESQNYEPIEEGGMDMSDMSMFTSIKTQAAVLAIATGALLLTFILARPAWRTVNVLPDQNSPAEIGNLLMGKYMIAFEGAGLLILLGIFASVLISRPSEHPDPTDREHLKAAVAENPAPVEAESIDPALHIESGEEQE